MPRRVYALVKPELLIWARVSARLEPREAAKKAKVAETKLLLWEDGAERPTLAQLRKLAKIYKRPLAVFYLPSPPSELGFDAMKDFRRLEWSADASISHELAVEIRQARERQSVARELLTALGERAVHLPHAPANTKPDEHAEVIRHALGVTLEQQHAWDNKYAALNAWVRAVENLGILVFQTGDVALDEMRGFSIPDDVVPAIVLNAKDDPKARAFTLVHELAHVMLGHGSLCDVVEDAARPPPSQQEEVYCNAVAASALVPTDDFRSRIAQLDRGEPGDDAVVELADAYKVSYEVALRRLLTFDRISRATFERRRDAYYAHMKGVERKPGFADYYRMVLRDNGPHFTGLVLTAYHQEAISASDVADYLGVKLNRLRKIEDRFIQTHMRRAV